MRASFSLEQLVGAPMPVGDFLPLAIRLCGAIAELHGRGAIHQELGPASILLDRATGDVALARPAGATALIECSLPYMSPEQTGQMNRPIDSRSDLYSLGVVLYQLLAGQLPFEADDPVGWVHCHVARQPRPLDEARPTIPRPLVDLVGKLLAKLPDHRYQSAAGLCHDLERCRGEWTERGAIAAFPLGERDVSEEFRIAQGLYGRDAEFATLREAFERVAGSGTPELILVSGYAGIGKSAVVRELLRPIAQRRGRFIAGKFEQYQRDVPYFTISQALRALALDILAEGEPWIARWRQRLAQALGSQGQLIVDLVPQLGLILGPQPPVPELPFTDAETRLRLVFGRLFAACATAEHPLTLFIDDLQWADTASLQLVAHLMTDREPRHLLVISAYRDNEVDPSHPMVLALEPVRRSGAPISEVVLGPLSDGIFGRLIADTVRTSPADAARFSGFVRFKTGGNPFFAIQFLTTIYHKRVIWFDREAYRWRWDVARVYAECYTDNVAELMRGRLHTLPAETRTALQLAACIGGTADAATLAIASGRDLAPALRPAIRSAAPPRERPRRPAHLSLLARPRARGSLRARARARARADPPRDRPAAAREHAAEELAGRVFEIVNQLDLGAALIETRQERERLAALHLAAGTRAQASTAHASALRYFAAGAALLADDALLADGSERRPELAFALELHRAECELMTGAIDAAEQRLAALAARAASLIDLAAVTTARIVLFTRRDRNDLAVAAGLEYLRRAGIEWTAHPSEEEIRREYDRIWQQIGARAIEALVDLPAMTDPDLRATMDLLVRLRTPALFVDDKLSLLMVCRMVNLSLEHGNTDASCTGYVMFGCLLGPRWGNPAAGFQFGRLGLELVERRGLARWKAVVYLEFGALIAPWTKHLRTGIELMRRAFDAAHEAGDLQYETYSISALVAAIVAAGEPLPSVQRESEAALAFVRKAGFGPLVDAILPRLQLVRSLRGLTRRFGSLDDEEFDESRFQQHLESAPHLVVATCWFWIRLLQARYLAGDHAGALAAAAKAQPLLWVTATMFEVAEHTFYAALACAAHHDAAPADERPALREAVAAHHAQLVAWAAHCPDNFGDRAALAGAELARLRGEPDRAIELYAQAIRAARDHGFVQNEAIAYETAARFHRGRGEALVDAQIAGAYVREAHNRYLRWGADGKARQLRDAHPELDPGPAGAASRPVLRPEQLAQLSVIKASQTISSVMDEDLLSRTLLRFVLVEGGARRVVLILARDGELEVAAEDRVDGADAAPGGARVPRSLLAYAHRIQEPVLLDASADAGRFAGDPYFAEARPRSVLCLPVRLRAASVALLYLENDLVPGAFTPERLLGLELLAAQAAISLENARLLGGERAGRIEAEAAKHRELLLGEATALMSQALESSGASDVLARLCERGFVDWAVIDLEQDGAMVQIAAAHRDPDKQPLLRQLAPRPRATSAGWQVPPAGEPLELPAIGDAQLGCGDDPHRAEIVRQLGARSAVAVALEIRGTVLGALSLVSAAPGRFGRPAVELAVELGRRMALAIDNARLLAGMRRALYMREEFLRIASHELRTPLASLRLTAQTLLHATERKRAIPPDFFDSSLRGMLGNTRRLEQLTSELLDVTRIENDRLELNLADVALDAIAREAIGHLEGDLAAAGSPVELACAAPVYGRWDPSRLEQVVTNLIGNAAKFGAGKPIEIRIDRTGDTARLAVIDRGIGIDPASLAHIFDRFERAVPSSRYGGLGLGLYIARSIVVAHGGTLTADSEPGAGATFTVILPCKAEARGD